eukprot:m.1399498 g.1399498  ORF g.1399498 m.1399498 type:complete len:59 (+) comp25002_c0_seq7:5631-5807(+)
MYHVAVHLLVGTSSERIQIPLLPPASIVLTTMAAKDVYLAAIGMYNDYCTSTASLNEK